MVAPWKDHVDIHDDGEIEDIDSAGNGPTDEPEETAGDPADRDELTPAQDATTATTETADDARPDEAAASDADAESSDEPSVIDQPLADFVGSAAPERDPAEAESDAPAADDPAVTQQMPAIDADKPAETPEPTPEPEVTADETDAAATTADEVDATTAGGSDVSADMTSDAAPAEPEAEADKAEEPVAPEPAVTQQMPVVDVPPIEAATPGPSEPKVYEAPTGAAGTTSPATPAPPLGGAYRPAPGPSEAETTEAAATTEPGAAEPEPEGERPRHMRVGRAGGAASTETEAATAPSADRRRVLAMVAPAVVLVLLLAAWAIDTATHSGQVLRNVELAGRSIDGVKEEDLPKVVSGIADDMAARTVTIKSGNKTYQATAGELGLAVDQQATVDAALDVGRGDSLLVRPFKWLGAFFSSRSAPVEFSMSKSTTAATLQRLQGADQTQPVEPQIQLAATGFTLVAGKPGVGIDVDEISKQLKEAAEAAPTGGITLTAESKEVDPTFSDEQAQGLADRANELTANGLKLNADGHTADVPAQTLRGWLSQTVTDGKLDLAFNADAAKAALPGLLGGVSAEPKNASVTLTNGVPTVVPGQNGVTCCGEDAGNQIWQALKDKKPDVALEAAVKEPEFTTDEVTAWGIKQPIGGNRGYKSGAEVNGGVGPGFTTYHGAGEPRNINIERIADEVRGAVIPPGGDFSINEYVGQRTYADGYVDAGAIRNSQHVSEVGGGISQFATTTFNAAYFAGLDITESQSHSEWFSRYPPGREATMGFPHPDVKIHNNTPYGVMIWTSYTPTSLTVTMYSTPYATAEQTGSQESMSGVCRVVVTTRTRTYPDGKPQQQDQFKSTYRPEGRLCSGAAVPPAPPH